MQALWLIDRLAEWKDDPFLASNTGTITYSELLDMVELCDVRFRQRGIGPGRVVALLGDFAPMACASLLALIDLGAIVVPLSRAALPKQKEFFKVAEVEAVVSLFDDGEWISRTGVSARHPLTLELASRGEPGLVLFSSGSTGESKAALHSFTPLLEKFKARRHKLVTLTFLLFDHIGGVNTLLYTLSNGGMVVSVKERDPDSVCAAIEQHKVELLPTSPTFINLLLVSEAHKRHDLSSLQIVTYGTEPMAESTLSRARAALPHVQFKQTYGLSEVGILRSKSRPDGSLWVQVGGEDYQTKVVDGRLFVKAKSAMLGYLNAPSPFDADGWMDTGDAVDVDGEWLRIRGRESELINVGGLKVYPVEVESVIQEVAGVAEVTVYGVKNPLTGSAVVARVTPSGDCPESYLRGCQPGLAGRVKLHCRQRLEAYKVPVRVIVTEEIQHGERYKKARSQARDN